MYIILHIKYTDYSVFLSHFTLLTWYQSHSSDFLVPVDISGVFPLPSSSSSGHCRSESPPSRPQYLQVSDIIVLLIQPPKQRHKVTEQPIPSKTQQRTARNYITRAPTRRQKFSASRARAPRASTRRHVPSVTFTRQFHAPHAPHAPAPLHVLPRQP